MAYYFLFPEKASTLYSHPDRETLNTGHDEILEIVKEKGTTNEKYYPSRVLIKFKNNLYFFSLLFILGFFLCFISLFFILILFLSNNLLITLHRLLLKLYLILETFAVLNALAYFFFPFYL